MRLRPATESDFPELTRIRVAGISSYASFMPERWEPPDESDPAERGKARMLDPDHWVTVAEHDDGTILGYVAAGPAMKEWSEGERVSGTAYLWMLFVDSVNTAAVHLFERLGFVIHHYDRAFVGDIQARR